ncbi:MAG: SLC13 family permease [Thermoanaerobaculales bacterium]|nr:SLC13 family permease [Thermoanaerobaculales bacterium]
MRVNAELTTEVGRWLGPLLFVVLYLMPTGDLEGSAKAVAGAALWMAVWWVTEAAPLAATSLLPMVLFPLLGVRPIRLVTVNYANHMVFLFLGGFALALAVERSGLHRRVALAVLDKVGASPRRLVWGFLLVTAGLSMWLSNTATTLMLLPIAAGVAVRMENDLADTRLFLAVAYGASVGGMATLVGTPPNLVLAGMAPELVPDLPALTFGGWMLFGLPLVMILIPLIGLRLGRGLVGGGGRCDSLGDERRKLGSVGPRERRAALLFSLTALAWITRPGFDFGIFRVPGWGDFLTDPKMVSDAVPAIAAAILATLLPAGDGKGARLLTWDDLHHGIPWGILLLFGGGFALADSVHASGLSAWLAQQLGGLAGLPLPLIILTLCLFATFATELTSNTATATLLLPVMAALSGILEVPPYLLMVAVTVSCSCAFMLPVATPPNAIVIGSGCVTTKEMFREGLWLNLMVAGVVTFFVLVWGPLVLPS